MTASIAAMDETGVTVDGNRLHVRAAGDPADHTLVFLHGGIVDAGPLSWGAVAPRFADDYHVVLPDLLGYGDSDCPAVDYTVERHVRTIRALADDVGDGDPVSLVGASLGGAISLGIVLDTDLPVARLALVDSYGLGTDLPNGRLTYLLSRVQFLNRVAVWLVGHSHRFARASMAGITRDPAVLSEDFVRDVQRYARKSGAGRAFRSFRAHEVTRRGYRTDFTERLGSVDVPTHLVHGAHDEVVPLAWARRAADRIPDAELTVLDDCGHLTTREDPDAVEAVLREFLAEVGE